MGVEQITQAAERIRELHDTHGLSWREIASTGEFGDVSHTTLRDVANGHEPGRAVLAKMGVRKTDYYTLAFRFHDRADFERIRAVVDRHPGGRAAYLMEMIENE